jgi:hypothetical protein
VLGIQMLHQDKGHSRVHWQIAHELGAGLNASGGGADGDDKEIVL